MKIQTLLKTILLVASAIAASLAHAGPRIWIDDSFGRIGTVDVETGLATVIGNSGVNFTDIAFDPNGNLYGVSFNTLYSINKATAAATKIGSLGISDANSLVFGADGTLYAVGNTSGNLYTINTATGTATVLFNTGYTSGGDLAFLNGTLYYTDALSLLSINLNSKQTTFIGSIGAYPVFGLAATDNGILYGVAKNSIYSINVSTGAGTLVSTYADGQAWAYGAAFYSGATECLLNWAEKNYVYLFAPAGSHSMVWTVYTYRYYSETNAYLGVSSADDHVYYVGADGNFQDEGSLSYWLPIAGC